MKKTKILIIASTLIFFVFSSCQKEDNTPDQSGTEASNIIHHGTWRITQYYDCGEDETNHFSGYAITFDSIGSVTAVNGSFTVNGNWNAGANTNPNEFHLHFGDISPFDEIDDDCWHIIENTASKIRLEDECDGVNDKDFITFEKN